MLCPRCRKLISRDEEICPYCGVKRPARRLPDIFQRWSATPGEIVVLEVSTFDLSKGRVLERK